MIGLINFVSNIIMFVSMVLFYIYLFGDYGNKKILQKWSLISHWTLRSGLIGVMTGSLFNVLTYSTPPWTEVVLNAGLALTFFWAYLFHKQMFDKQK